MIFFQKNIKHIRRIKKMTLLNISEELDFSPSQWNNYELGISYPKFLDLIKISKYFEISESDLIHRDLTMDTLIMSIETHNNIEIISLQNKLIKIQEEKINELKIQLDIQKKLEVIRPKTKN